MVKKTIFILILVVMFINILAVHKVYAIEYVSKLVSDADDFLKAGEDDAVDEENLRIVSEYIYKVFLVVAIAMAVIVGSYIGIKIMVGTIEEKAKIKEMLVPYIVGVIVIFSTFTIWSVVVKFGTKLVE